MNIRRAKRTLPIKYLYLFFAAGLAFISCNPKAGIPNDHPDYFDAIFEKAEAINSINPKKGLAYVDSVYAVFPGAGIKDLYRKYEYRVNYYIENDAQNHKALQDVDSMLWVIRDHKQEAAFVKDYANALVKKSNLLIFKKDYADAFEYNYKARQAMEKTNDSCLLGSYTFMLSTVCYQQGKYLDAARYNIEAIKEVSTCPVDYRQFKNIQAKLDDIALAFLHIGMRDSAMYYFNAAISYIDNNIDSFASIPNSKLFAQIAKGVVYGNIGDVYLQQGDTATAEQYYKQDVNTTGQKYYDHGDGQCTQLKIVNLYLMRRRLPDAERSLMVLRHSLDSFPDINNELKWYKLQMEYLDVTGQTAKQTAYFKPYIKIKDSLAAIKPIPQVDLIQGYEQIKDRYEIALLANENVRKDYYLGTVLICALVVLTIAVILWYYWKRGRKQNDKITQQNSEMELALMSLAESEKRNTNLMQIVAHDLRNPVASMISITSILLDNPDIKGDDREMLELMQKSSEHSIEMITDILNIDTNAASIVKSPAQIAVLLRYCIDLLQFRATEKHQQITLETEDVTLSINKEKIWRVISNLIVNAIKFSPEGAAIQVRGRREKDQFIITVKDHGIGIPDKMKVFIFDMFTDAKRPGTAGEQSFGLGLAISRQIIEAHGGKIWFESEAGKGTTFFIALPV